MTPVVLSTPITQILISKSHLPLKVMRESNDYRLRRKWYKMSPRHPSVSESNKFSKTDGNKAKHTEAQTVSHLPKSGSPSIKTDDKNAILGS